MIIPLKKYLFLLLFPLLLFNGCVPEEEKVKSQVFGIEADGWIYSDLILRGLDLDLDCSNNKITLERDGQRVGLEITDCLISFLIAHIPEDLEPGLYSIIAEIDGNTFTEVDGVPMEVEVKNRPVVFPLGSTNLRRGELFGITGLHLLNETDIPEYDPLVG